jgi:hypothetical protein
MGEGWYGYPGMMVLLHGVPIAMGTIAAPPLLQQALHPPRAGLCQGVT